MRRAGKVLFWSILFIGILGYAGYKSYRYMKPSPPPAPPQQVDPMKVAPLPCSEEELKDFINQMVTKWNSASEDMHGDILGINPQRTADGLLLVVEARGYDDQQCMIIAKTIWNDFFNRFRATAPVRINVDGRAVGVATGKFDWRRF